MCNKCEITERIFILESSIEAVILNLADKKEVNDIIKNVDINCIIHKRYILNLKY